MLNETEQKKLNAIRERQAERETASGGDIAEVDFLLDVIHELEETKAMRAKLRQYIENLEQLDDADLSRVLVRIPYKVCGVWMVSEPRPDLSEKMGYPCFEAVIIK